MDEEQRNWRHSQENLELTRRKDLPCFVLLILPAADIKISAQILIILVLLNILKN